MKQFLVKYRVIIISVVIGLILIILYWQRENIAENRITTAKIEIFKAAKDKDFDKVKSVLDSLNMPSGKNHE